MAMYLYKGLCYSAPSFVYSAMAADCPTATATGFGMTCDSFEYGYRVYVNNQVVTMVYPNLELCIPEVADAAQLGGLVVAALAAAFALKILWRAI